MDGLIFNIYPSITRFAPFTDKVIKIIDEIASFRPRGYIFSKKYQEGVWDGWYRFRNGIYIPTGIFFALVEPKLKEKNIKYSTNYYFKYIESSSTDISLCGIKIRDYQEQIIKIALRKKRCIIKLPTNAGKTEVALAIIKSYNRPFVFVVHKKELFYQTFSRIEERLGFKVGLVGDGNYDYDFEKGMVVMIQTLCNLDKETKKKILSVPVLIVDELHHYSGRKWYNELLFSGSVIRYGLTATPIRNDEVKDWQLVALVGEVIGDVTNKFLIDSGYSAKPVVHMIHILEPMRSYQCYAEACQKLIVDSVKRYKVIEELVKMHKNKKILICVDRIEQGERVKEVVRNFVSVEFIKGNDDMKFRLEAIRRFMSDGLNCLVSTLLDESIDIPCIEVLILAYPCRSIVKVLQRIGRGMRKSEKKDSVIVYDLVDCGSKYFINQARDRQRIYLSEGFEVNKLFK